MDMRLGRILLQSGLVLLLAALFVQGALKDGVTTWIPVYIQETYGVSPILAVAGTMVIPLCNLFGVWLAAAACRHMERNEIAMSAGFFAVCSAALMVLWLSSGKSMAASMGMLALSTTTMMTVNTLLTAVLPSCFGRVGKASSMSGLLNSAVYSGGAVSAYGIGSIGRIFWLDSHDFNLGGDGGSLCLNLRHRCEKMGYLPQKTCGRRTLKRY